MSGEFKELPDDKKKQIFFERLLNERFILS